MKTVFSIGYGGRSKDDFLSFMRDNGICTVVDVRLRPDRASMDIWVKTKTPEKGIEKWLSEAGIGYRSIVELGNVFMECDDGRERYRKLLESSGNLLINRLENIPEPWCLLCAERRVSECHRELIADYLANKLDVQIIHLE